MRLETSFGPCTPRPLRALLCLVTSGVVMGACGSAVAVDDEAATNSTGPETPTDVESTGSMEETDESSTGEPMDPPAADVPPESGECWRREPLFEAPLEVATSIVDQDGDGEEEIWLQVIFGNDPEDTSPVFALDRHGEVVAEHPIDGIFRNFGDIDGDGYLDIGMFQVGVGQPLPRYVPATGALAFERSFVPFELPSNFLRTAGFFDLTQDGVADVFLLNDSGGLELLRGESTGAFEAAGSVAFPDATGVRAFPVDGADDLAIVHTATRITSAGQPDDCTPQNFFVAEVTRDGALSLLGESAAGLELGQYYGAAVPPGATGPEVFVGTCRPGKTTYDVRRLAVSTDGALVDTPVVTDAVWASVFDYDGDGVLDIAHLDAVGSDIVIEKRSLDDGDPQTISTAIDGDVVPTNRAFATDLDGDGREELVLAGEDLGNGAHRYELLYLGACE